MKKKISTEVLTSSDFFFFFFHFKEQTPRKRKDEKVSLLDPTTADYQIAVFILFPLLCLAVCTGLVYHFQYKKSQKRRYDRQGM